MGEASFAAAGKHWRCRWTGSGYSQQFLECWGLAAVPSCMVPGPEVMGQVHYDMV